MRCAILGIAALCLASPLVAQDGSEITKARTKESAQEFLQVTSANSPVGFGIIAEWNRNQSSAMRFEGGFRDIPCTSNLVGTFRYETFSPAEQRWKEKVEENFQYPIYWNMIAKVTQSGNRVRLDWTNVSPVEIYYPSDDLAKRAASAMEFLRLECDPTKDLAF